MQLSRTNYCFCTYVNWPELLTYSYTSSKKQSKTLLQCSKKPSNLLRALPSQFDYLSVVWSTLKHQLKGEIPLALSTAFVLWVSAVSGFIITRFLAAQLRLGGQLVQLPAVGHSSNPLRKLGQGLGSSVSGQEIFEEQV